MKNKKKTEAINSRKIEDEWTKKDPVGHAQLKTSGCGCGSTKSHRLQHEDYMDNLYKRVFVAGSAEPSLDIQSKCHDIWNQMINGLRGLGYNAPEDGNTIVDLMTKYISELYRIEAKLTKDCRYQVSRCKFSDWCEEGHECRECALSENPVWLEEYCRLWSFQELYQTLMPSFADKDALCWDWANKLILSTALT